MKENEESPRPKKEPVTMLVSPIGEHTPIQLGIIIIFVGAMLAGFGHYMRREGISDTKMDMMLARFDKIEQKLDGDMAKVKGEVAMILSWKEKVEATGTPALAKRVEELKADIETIKNKFELHEATTKQKP